MRYFRHFLVLVLLAAGSATATAQLRLNKDDLRTGPKVLQAFHYVVEKPSQETVRVLCDGQEAALGAIVESDGLIITKASVLKGKITCKMKGGQVFDAKLIGAEESYDLALLKIDATDLATVEWRNTKETKVGQWVATVGVTSEPVAIGVVSVATRKLAKGDQPSKNSNANSGWLGVGIAEGDGGAKISEIFPKSPAQKAGLKVNDIVVEAAGKRIIDNESLVNTIQRLKPGDSLPFKIKRGEEDLTITATLAKRPKELAGNPQEMMGSKLSDRRGGFPAILQHDTVLKPTDCGGPLVDLDGKTVGINIARAGRTESYAIPSEDVRVLLVDLKNGKYPPKSDDAKLVPTSPDQILRVTSSLNDKDKLRSGGQSMKVHEVKLMAGATYSIAMDSTDFDSYLILEDADKKKLAEDDDSGGDFNAKITFQAKETGTYRIIATSYGPKVMGNYTLTVTREAEPKKDKK